MVVKLKIFSRNGSSTGCSWLKQIILVLVVLTALEAGVGSILLGSHTYSVRVFCFSRRVCLSVCHLSVPHQISITN